MPKLENYPVVTMKNGDKFHVCASGVIDGRQTDYPPPPEEQIAVVIDWLQERNRVIRTPSIGSYQAKHAAERYWGDHVFNGALIVAADRLQIPQKLVERGSRNTKIAISKRVFQKLGEANQ